MESEEKAFATLVSLYPETSKWLGKLFRDVHRPDGHHHPGEYANNLERDEILQRRKERNFGFKLFIRTFIQVCAYRFTYSPGSNSFSFDVVNSLPFQMRLRNNSKEIERLFKRTDKVVQFVRWDILHNGLKCDDLQTLPDTVSLLPLFQVLIRFPTLMEPGMKEQCAPVLQCLTLRLLLSQNQIQEKILKLVNEVNRAETDKVCLENLHEGIRPQLADLQTDLNKRLEAANTLMDRHVLLLYWLLRRQGASDFSYRNLPESKPLRARHGQEVALSEGVEPEKQHIVPYYWLEKLYGIEKRGRISRHEVNNIGNITYISRELNHWETGLGGDPIDLELEKERREAPDNLARHFLGPDGEVGEAYKTTIAKVKNSPDEAARKMAKEAFEKFCELRRKLIAAAFAEWVQKLPAELTVLEEVKPAPRVDPSLWDRVRRLDCPDDIENAMLDMITNAQLRFRLWPSKKTSTEKWVGLVSLPPDNGFIIRFFGDRLEIEPADGSALYGRLRGLMVGKVFQKERGMKSGSWVLPAQGKESVITSEILIEFGQQVSDTNLAG